MSTGKGHSETANLSSSDPAINTNRATTSANIIHPNFELPTVIVTPTSGPSSTSQVTTTTSTASTFSSRTLFALPLSRVPPPTRLEVNPNFEYYAEIQPRKQAASPAPILSHSTSFSSSAPNLTNLPGLTVRREEIHPQQRAQDLVSMFNSFYPFRFSN